MSALVVPYHPGYGAPELKKNLQKYIAEGFLIAAALHFMAIGAYWSSIFFGASEEKAGGMRLIRSIAEIGPPPSIAGSTRAVGVSAAPSVGIPVPVPDAEVSPEQTIPRQDELPGDTPVEGVGDGNVAIGIDEPPKDFVEYEKAPVVIHSVSPAYPELARRAGIEGNVHLKVWVDQEGKIRRAEILKSDAEIFNQPAIDAAMQWVFTPALMNNGPVSVWVSIPFRFRLHGQ